MVQILQKSYFPRKAELLENHTIRMFTFTVVGVLKVCCGELIGLKVLSATEEKEKVVAFSLMYKNFIKKSVNLYYTG